MKDYGEFETQSCDQDGREKQIRQSEGCGETAFGEESRCTGENDNASGPGEIRQSDQSHGKVFREGDREKGVGKIGKDFNQVQTGQERGQARREQTRRFGQNREVGWQTGCEEAAEDGDCENGRQTGAKKQRSSEKHQQNEKGKDVSSRRSNKRERDYPRRWALRASKHGNDQVASGLQTLGARGIHGPTPSGVFPCQVAEVA